MQGKITGTLPLFLAGALLSGFAGIYVIDKHGPEIAEWTETHISQPEYTGPFLPSTTVTTIWDTSVRLAVDYPITGNIDSDRVIYDRAIREENTRRYGRELNPSALPDTVFVPAPGLPE